MLTASISRRAFGASLFSLATPALRARPSVEATRITMSVGPRAAFVFRHLPLTIAQQLGFFESEGVALSVQAYASDALALQAMHDGVADVCAVDFEQILRMSEVITSAARCFVLQNRAPQAALGVSVRALPRLTALADLRRRRVGVCALGSLSHTVACLALARAGLAADEVSFVVVGEGASARAALRSGRVHALCHGDPLMTQLEHQGEVRIVSDTRTLSGAQALFGGSMPGGCLVAPAAFLQKRATDAQALANGVVHGLKWLQTAAPADLVKVLPASSLGGERSLYLSAFARARETFSPDGMMPIDGPATALRALVLADPYGTALHMDPARTFTPEFARKAKQKFSA